MNRFNLMMGLIAVLAAGSLAKANLVLEYTFESAPGGVVSDTSGFGTAIDLTLFGDASIVTDGTRGNVLSLDGDGDYGATAANTIGNKLDTQNSHTMMAWVKTTSTSRQAVVTRTTGPGYAIELSETPGTAGLVHGHVGGPGQEAYSVTVVTDGEWHHVAQTFNGSDLHVYVDGVLEGSNLGVSVTDSTQTTPFHVGQFPGLGRFFLGSIDDVRVYNSVLNEGQILAASGIPEPATLGLLAMGGLLMLRRRK